ncbi:MAG: hypothetical protein ACREIF_10345 [Chthoniobacterales bacterium]
MKQPLLLVILAVLTYVYFRQPDAPTSPQEKTDPAAQNGKAVASQTVIIAPAPPYYDRWKTGPTAQNDWKTGPNAQTNFEPFAPSEQAAWNQTPGYTIVSGGRIRR